MGYRTIRFSGWMFSLLGIGLGLIAPLQLFGLLAHDQSLGAISMLGFMFLTTLGTVATATVNILEEQADQISDLKRQLADRASA